jgi:hypothetical protein
MTCKAMLFRTIKEARIKEVTGLLHISDRLLAGESSRVEAARGTLQSLPIDINTSTFFALTKKSAQGIIKSIGVI